MAQFIVRNLEEDVKARLKRRAEPAPRLGSRIAARFAKSGLTAELPELHGRAVRLVDFGQ